MKNPTTIGTKNPTKNATAAGAGWLTAGAAAAMLLLAPMTAAASRPLFGPESTLAGPAKPMPTAPAPQPCTGERGRPCLH